MRTRKDGKRYVQDRNAQDWDIKDHLAAGALADVSVKTKEAI